MNHIIRILILCIFSVSLTNAQSLKGKITTQSGEPIQYSTVYIQELKQGTTSNTRGDYEIRVPAGKYTVIYQSLGYEPLFFTLTLSDKTITKDVILPVQIYEIPEVRISATGEDPAYSIMRKAIGLAPYYLNNINYYKAEVYLKGNLVIKRIPKILQKSMKREAKRNSASVSGGGKPQPEEKIIKAGDSFLMESYNEMEFTAPDKYLQKVISYNSTFPEEGNEISPMDFIEASFYQPIIADIAISPLSPSAFSHYNFKYIGASLQGNYTINKIQVIPKRKSQQLFEGTIYIIDDLWCLQSVDLINENLVGTIKIQQIYIPVQNGIWMPVSHKFEINIAIVGFKADAGYGSSVKYLDVKPNLALQKPKAITANFTGKPEKMITDIAPVTPSKEKQKIDKILEKDQISNRDMVKLARLMEKETENSVPDSIKKNLEIKDNTTHIIEKDANKKDSAYWAQIRPIPLSDIEMRSIKVSDSIKAVSLIQEKKRDTINSTDKSLKKRSPKTVRYIFMGHTWSDTTGFRFRHGGLIDPKNLSFNTVDGFVYGLDFGFEKSWKEGKTLNINPQIMWAFSRQQLIWRVNSFYKFNGMKQSQIYLRTGMASNDINNAGGINTLLNSFTSLFFINNYLKLYESRYLKLGYISDIANGLKMEIYINYENRRVLQNTTDFSIINSSKDYTENVPVNRYLEPDSNPINFLSDQEHYEFTSKFTYTPFQKYRIQNGNKIPEGSDWPTFSILWQHGINKFSQMSDMIKHYDLIRLEVSKNRNIGAFSEFKWRFRTGGFLDNRFLSFYDFFHFNSQTVPLLLNNYEDAFMIPSYYTMSTPEFYGEIHLKYTTPYLLLKLLPGLSNTLMRENLTLSYLGSRFHPNYTEVGYSLSEILLLGEIGVYTGFDNLKYRSVGAKLVLRFN